MMKGGRKKKRKEGEKERKQEKGRELIISEGKLKK